MGFSHRIGKVTFCEPNRIQVHDGHPTKYWCMHAFDKHVKSRHTTNNIIEAFNSWVDKCRSIPALLLLDNIICKMIKRIHMRFQATQKWTCKLTPMVINKIVARQEKLRFVDVLCASEHEFEIKDELKYVQSTYKLRVVSVAYGKSLESLASTHWPS
ncbi:hypothetical protein ACOSQ3_021059 [Xanthoceras sorbifolium]